MTIIVRPDESPSIDEFISKMMKDGSYVIHEIHVVNLHSVTTLQRIRIYTYELFACLVIDEPKPKNIRCVDDLRQFIIQSRQAGSSMHLEYGCERFPFPELERSRMLYDIIDLNDNLGKLQNRG